MRDFDEDKDEESKRCYTLHFDEVRTISRGYLVTVRLTWSPDNAPELDARTSITLAWGQDSPEMELRYNMLAWSQRGDKIPDISYGQYVTKKSNMEKSLLKKNKKMEADRPQYSIYSIFYYFRKHPLQKYLFIPQ